MNTLAEITSADRELLAKRWESLFEHEPPPQIHTALMRRVLAWNVQMHQAGLDPFAGRSTAVRPPVVLRPGTRLLREWQGTTHEVRVLDAGFDYAGQTYTSLSAIARAITGTPWSGPLFFGIKR
jgi:CubicO group peptidase (beta-lactamase class C family)